MITFLIQDDTTTRDWNYSKNAFEALYRVLPTVTEPGDRIIIFRIGPSNFDDALVFIGTVGNVARPAIASTLTPWPTVTATVTPAQPTSDVPLFQTAAAVVATKTQGWISETATAADILNSCGEAVWANDFAAVATQWEATREAVKLAFGTQTSNITPGSGENAISNQVYEGLDHATRAFNDECKPNAYRRCLLIVFSDLSDWRPSVPHFQVPVSLKGVEVLSIMLNCPVLFSPNCSGVREKWLQTFKSFGAQNSTFINGDNLDKQLIDFIRR